jgi:hypothetical protein
MRSVWHAIGLGVAVAFVVGVIYVVFRNPACFDYNRTFGPDGATWSEYILPNLAYGAVSFLTVGGIVGAVAYGIWRLPARFRHR